MTADLLPFRRPGPAKPVRCSKQLDAWAEMAIAWHALKCAHECMEAEQNTISRALFLAAAERHQRLYDAWCALGGPTP